MKKSALTLGGFLLMLASAAMAQDVPPLGHQLSPLPAPMPAPVFTLNDSDGNPVRLADYIGKVVLVNFWGTWCPPCRREMPSMERAYEHLRDKGFVVLAINQTETPDDVFIYTSQLSLAPTFKILFDKDSGVAGKYRVVGLPTSYLIDKTGQLRYRAIGGREFDSPEVEQEISRLIDEK